jgi:polyhydroxyalkanoate synthesis repressor PhaR
MPEKVKLTPNQISDTLPESRLIKPFKFGDIIIHPALTLLCCAAFDLSGINAYVTKNYFALQHCVFDKHLLAILPSTISEMFMTPKQAVNQVVIRKYANRRLYDTNASRYVTIDDLKLMVKNNRDFRVVDAKNGQDLTRFTLVQIILEIESEGHKLLPIGVLQQLIRFYGDKMEPILSRYLERSMNAFLDHQGQAEDALGASFDAIRSSGNVTAAAKNVTSTDNLQLIRDEFDQLKAKLDRLG